MQLPEDWPMRRLDATYTKEPKQFWCSRSGVDKPAWLWTPSAACGSEMTDKIRVRYKDGIAPVCFPALLQQNTGSTMRRW